MLQEKALTDILQWDVKNWSEAVRYWDDAVKWDEVETCLELGGRDGGLSTWLALKGKKVVCSDLYDPMGQALQGHRKYGVDSLISYRSIDATAIPYECYFDVVVFKSVLGGVGRNDNKAMQQRMWNEIHKALKPGGRVLFAENLIASPVHQFFRKHFTKWGNSWRYVSLDEVKEFLQEYSSYQVRATGVLGAFGRTERQRNVFSAFDRLLVNNICAQSWKYIVYGVAVKCPANPAKSA